MKKFKDVTICKPEFGVLKNPLVNTLNATAKITDVIIAVYLLFGLKHFYLLYQDRLLNCWYTNYDKVIYRKSALNKLTNVLGYVL